MESEPGRAEGVQFFWGLFAQEQDENDKIQLQSCKQTKPQQLDKKKTLTEDFTLESQVVSKEWGASRCKTWKEQTDLKAKNNLGE